MATLKRQELLRLPATQQHRATVIFLHGLGQSNVTWSLVIREALAPRLPHVEWLLPQAICRPVSLNQGQKRPSWFDISRLPPGDNEFDEQSISESVNVVENLILSQVHSGIDSRNIVLVGFSQGAALSMMVSLTTLHDLGGAASLSGWIPRRARHLMIHTAPTLPILWCHGTADREIPISFAEDAISFLRHPVGLPSSKIHFKAYHGLKHNINDDELSDLVSWLAHVIG